MKLGLGCILPKAEDRLKLGEGKTFNQSLTNQHFIPIGKAVYKTSQLIIYETKKWEFGQAMSVIGKQVGVHLGVILSVP